MAKHVNHKAAKNKEVNRPRKVSQHPSFASLSVSEFACTAPFLSHPFTICPPSFSVARPRLQHRPSDINRKPVTYELTELLKNAPPEYVLEN